MKLYSGVLKVRNILSVFDEFIGREILTERDIQDYHSMYIDLYHKFRTKHTMDKVSINDDLIFEMELIKQVEINIDYILDMIKKYHTNNIKDKEILADINRAIESSVELRNKKDLIDQFIESLDISSQIDEDWITFVEKKKQEELQRIIEEENLNPEETHIFIKNAFRNGEVLATGTALAKILPPVSRFSPDGERTKKRENVIARLMRFFERFFDISGKEIEQ